MPNTKLAFITHHRLSDPCVLPPLLVELILAEPGAALLPPADPSPLAGGLAPELPFALPLVLPQLVGLLHLLLGQQLVAVDADVEAAVRVGVAVPAADRGDRLTAVVAKGLAQDRVFDQEPVAQRTVPRRDVRGRPAAAAVHQGTLRAAGPHAQLEAPAAGGLQDRLHLVAAEELQLVPHAAQVLLPEVLLRLDIPDLLGRIGAPPEVVLEVLGVDLLVAPAVEGTAEEDAGGLFGLQMPLGLPALLGTALLVPEPPPGAARADLLLAAPALQRVGQRLQADQAAVLVLVEVPALYEVRFVVVQFQLLLRREHFDGSHYKLWSLRGVLERGVGGRIRLGIGFWDLGGGREEVRAVLRTGPSTQARTPSL